jgi:FkbM family methyltransferase
VAAGPSGRVIAFEPHPDLFAVLQRTVTLSNAANDIAPVIARNAALGDCEGQATLSVPDGFDVNDGVSRVRSASHGAAIPIRIHTIDQVLDSEPAELLKIDVEGDELLVLRGAAAALKTHRIQHVIFEDFDGNDSQACRLLESFGYQTFAIGWSVRGPRLRPAGEGSLARTYEAPSYLATLDPDGALKRCASSGWHVLRPRLGRTA